MGSVGDSSIPSLFICPHFPFPAAIQKLALLLDSVLCRANIVRLRLAKVIVGIRQRILYIAVRIALAPPDCFAVSSWKSDAAL
jgi:hypothetical protein